MKRLHVNVTVENLKDSIRFYAHLFAAEPTVVKPDYAKWMLDDPRVNFAITTHGSRVGIDHLGIQAETEEEMKEIQGRLNAAESPVLDQGEVTCCYAKSDKSWIADPQGIAWETFLTRGESAEYGATTELAALSDASACCTPKLERASATSSCGCR